MFDCQIASPQLFSSLSFSPFEMDGFSRVALPLLLFVVLALTSPVASREILLRDGETNRAVDPSDTSTGQEEQLVHMSVGYSNGTTVNYDVPYVPDENVFQSMLLLQKIDPSFTFTFEDFPFGHFVTSLSRPDPPFVLNLPSLFLSFTHKD